VVVQIDEDEAGMDIPLAEDGPSMVIRLAPMAGGLCRFSYTTTDEDNERSVINSSEVPEKIVTTSKSRLVLADPSPPLWHL
jgi:hypothetical protein